MELLTLFQGIVGRGLKLSKRKDNGSQVRYATQIDVIMLVYESGMAER
jgi:hypothetical protein